jgi:hypothetical protein
MVMDPLLADTCVASVTWKVNEALPGPVGVPLMRPVALVRLKPRDAKDPEMTLHANGAVPPDSVRVALYATPAVAAGKEVVVIAGRGFTIICSVADFDELAIEVAVTVAVNALATEDGAL